LKIFSVYFFGFSEIETERLPPTFENENSVKWKIPPFVGLSSNTKTTVKKKYTKTS